MAAILSRGDELTQCVSPINQQFMQSSIYVVKNCNDVNVIKFNRFNDKSFVLNLENYFYQILISDKKYDGKMDVYLTRHRCSEDWSHNIPL